ncbi:MAG: RNA polymerase sigma factor [Eubacteriales bacterium]
MKDCEEGDESMEDEKIVELFFARSEKAIDLAQEKYGGLSRRIAGNILGTREDAEECVSDAFFRLWNRIPPEKPRRLGAFVAAITRNLSLDALEKRKAFRRGGGQTDVCLEELEECLPDGAADAADSIVLKDALNGFLAGLKPETRRIFLKRYWYMCSISEIAEDCGVGESKVKMSLLRARKELKRRLEREEIEI